MKTGTAQACANIALAKYWGKRDSKLNLPAVPSLSMTLDGLVTQTTVTFDEKLLRDELLLDGVSVEGRPLKRVSDLLDRLRMRAGSRARARVETGNTFPTGAGLASSASGFAALTKAAAAALGLNLSPNVLSAIARRSSASAARSIFSGFVELPVGKDDSLSARRLAPASHWDLRMVVAITSEHAKQLSSTRGMEYTRETSPYYVAWVARAHQLFEEVREAVLAKDLAQLGPAVEQSAFAMHACALAARPAILYWQPGTLTALQTVRRLRDEGIDAWATMDGGPQVKVLCEPPEEPAVKKALDQTPGVSRTICARVGGPSFS